MHTSPQGKMSLTFRAHRPGDIGHIISRNGVLYNDQFNWSMGYEAHVAHIMGDFIENFDSEKEYLWVAEKDGRFQGNIMLCKDIDTGRPNVARLRVLLVEPEARGLGLGTKLIAKCVDFAREKGYQAITLTTRSKLVTARKLYASAGFELVKRDIAAGSFVAKKEDEDVYMEEWEMKL